MLALRQKNIKITFKDCGQGFQSWVIDKQGNVIDSQPEYAPDLAHTKVLDRVFHKDLRLTVDNGFRKLTLSHTIEKAEEMD